MRDPQQLNGIMLQCGSSSPASQRIISCRIAQMNVSTCRRDAGPAAHLNQASDQPTFCPGISGVLD